MYPFSIAAAMMHYSEITKHISSIHAYTKAHCVPEVHVFVPEKESTWKMILVVWLHQLVQNVDEHFQWYLPIDSNYDWGLQSLKVYVINFFVMYYVWSVQAIPTYYNRVYWLYNKWRVMFAKYLYMHNYYYSVKLKCYEGVSKMSIRHFSAFVFLVTM